MPDDVVPDVACREFDHHVRGLEEAERYDLYDQVRACPVARSEKHGGFWILSHYADVVEAEMDWTVYSSASGVFHPVEDSGRMHAVALEQDPPEHTVYRRLYHEMLSRPRVSAAEPGIRQLARRRIDRLAAGGGGDFVASVAVPVPIEVIALLLGLDDADAEQLRDLSEKAWSELRRPAQAVSPETARGLTLGRLLRSAVEARRDDPRDDFLTDLAHTMVDGAPLPSAGLSSFLVGAVIAGHDTTLSAATNLALQIGADPALQRRLVADPSLIPRAVDESLRHRSPVQSFFRTLTRDVTLHGVTMAAGEKVMLLYGAANRDPEQFREPASFDLDRYGTERDVRRHVAYGWGIHRCAGAYLAEVELRLIVEELLRYELAVDGSPTYVPTAHGAFLAPEALHVRLSPRRVQRSGTSIPSTSSAL